MYTGLLHTHRLVVTLFLFLYLIKLVLLLINKQEALERFSKRMRIPEMVLSALFLITGVVMLVQVAQITTLTIAKVVMVLASIPIAIIGFKRRQKVLAALSVVLILGAYGMAEADKIGVSQEALPQTVQTDPQTSEYDAIAHGKAIYDRNCIVCHGEHGKKQASGAKDITLTQLSEEELYQLVLNGKNSMPSYRGVLNEAEISAVLAYVETL